MTICRLPKVTFVVKIVWRAGLCSPRNVRWHWEGFHMLTGVMPGDEAFRSDKLRI